VKPESESGGVNLRGEMRNLVSMLDVTSIEEALRRENAGLRARLEELDETLRAIRGGEVDAIVVEGRHGPQIFMLEGLDAESNRFRGEIISQISESVIATDAESRVIYLNAAAERAYGVNSSEILGRHLRDMYEQRWVRPQDEAVALVALREHGRWHGENIHIKHGGQLVHVESSVSRLDAENGSAPGLLAVIRDVTERKLEQERAWESEQRIRAIYDGTNDYIGLLTTEGILLDCNRASLTFGNNRRDEVLGKPFWETVWFSHTPGAPEAMREWIERAARGEFIRRELPLTAPSGQVTIFDFSLSPVRDQRGHVIFLVPEGRDITEWKRGEVARLRSEERLRKIYEHAATGIAITDMDGHFEQCNPAYCALLDYTEAELRHLQSADLVHPEDRKRNLAEMIRLQEEELPFFEIENRYLRKDGASVWVHKTYSVLRGESGKPEHLVALVTDVTERRRVAEALQEAKEAAEAANRSKDRFLAVLSHELRTPLTPALMAVGMLEHDPELRADVREDLSMIKRNLELETKLIDDLLDLTRITSGKLKLRLETVDLNETVQRVCAICEQQVRERGVRLETDLQRETGRVVVDSARFQQVLWNVLKNAIKFTPQDGVIRVSTARVDGHWEIRVRDSGIGIAPGMHSRIFDAFEQGGDGVTRKFGGLGLGLAICKALVEMHHGTIRAESDGLGFGSTFIIELPKAVPATATSGHHGGNALGESRRRLRLLVVEDHPDTSRALQRQLRDAGYDVVMASNVADARAATEANSFDVLVSDIGLPDGQGYDIMRRFRARHAAPGIAMSGYGMDEDLLRSHEAGFTEHLVKPIDVAKLITAIQRVTEDRG
jgi:PAS domain S-box-containing protein